MKKLLFTLLGLAAALTLPAQDFKITHGPWLCDMTEDGVTVLWTTNKPALSWVEATEDDGRSFYAAEHTRHYETVAGRKQAHQDTARRAAEQPASRNEILLPHLLAGGTRMETRRQRPLRQDRCQQCLQTRAVPVPDIPGNGNRLFVRHPERHPRTRRRHDRTVPGNQFRQTRLRNAQRRHVQQH